MAAATTAVWLSADAVASSRAKRRRMGRSRWCRRRHNASLPRAAPRERGRCRGRPPPIWSARASPPPARVGALSLSLSHQQQAPECGTTMRELGQRFVEMFVPAHRNQRRPPEDDSTARDRCRRRPRMDPRWSGEPLAEQQGGSAAAEIGGAAVRDQYAYMVLNCFLIGFNSNS